MSSIRDINTYLSSKHTQTIKNKQEKIAHHYEVAELYEQIGRLKVENDFLEKVLKKYQ